MISSNFMHFLWIVIILGIVLKFSNIFFANEIF